MSDQEKNLPKVSIIIPVYNVEPYISACLHSVMNQTYTGELECIIVDDQGTDSSMAVAEREVNAYNGKVCFKIIHREKNGGLSAARNTGIRQATGDYLYFLDSDDEITPDCIALLAEKAASLQPDFVIGGYRVTGTNKKYPSLNLPDGTFLQGEDIIKTYSQSKWYMMAWGKLVNRKFLTDKDLYFKEGLLHEDELWSFQLACLAQSMAVVNKETYVYKVREGSITENAKTAERRTKSILVIIKEVERFLTNNPSLIASVYTCDCFLRQIYVYGICLSSSNLPHSLKNEMYQKAVAASSIFHAKRKIGALLLSPKNFLEYLFVCLPLKLVNLHRSSVYRLIHLIKSNK